ncbi:hypothetical protein E4U53_004644, partial [Claviceps sorghi]
MASPSASISASISASTSASTSAACPTRVTKIPGRSRLPDEAAANPHHVLNKAGTAVASFKNPYPSWSNPPGLWSMLRNVFWPTLTGRLKWPDTSPPTVPVRTPEWRAGRSSSSSAAATLRATWLGHACYYVEFPSGLRVLFDPVLEDRCSPVGFAGPRRYTEPPCRAEDVPAVDAVVISHSHYDHLSHASVVAIRRRHPDVHFFVGLGLETWFRSRGLDNVTELDWWEDADLCVTVRGPARRGTKADDADDADDAEPEPEHPRVISARISALPCQHTSARSPWDRDTTLWCSWAVVSGGKSVWFGGDTGYRAVPRRPAAADPASLPHCPQFAQIGRLRGPFDLGLIPIGAYHPPAAFSAMHANPFDSVDIFVDTACRRAMGIHWGTWALTMEDVLEPPRLLREALRRKGIAEEGVFDV